MCLSAGRVAHSLLDTLPLPFMLYIASHINNLYNFLKLHQGSLIQYIYSIYPYTYIAPHKHLDYLSIIPSHKCLHQQLLNGLTSYFNLVYVVLKWNGWSVGGGGFTWGRRKEKKKNRWFAVVSSSGYLSRVKSESNSLPGDSAWRYSSSWRFAVWQLRGVSWMGGEMAGAGG